MCYRLFFLVLFFVSAKGVSQHDFSTYNAHQSLVEAIRINSEVIEGRTSFFEKKAASKPLMFQKTKVRLSELNRISNNLTSYIEKLQKEVNSENILYDLLDSNFYNDIVFNADGNLSRRGVRLKTKIDSLYQISERINVHKLSQLENFYKDHFKTNGEYYDFDQNKINYFDHLFYDKSNYGIMMAMNYLLLDVKSFQLLYYGTIMSY